MKLLVFILGIVVAVMGIVGLNAVQEIESIATMFAFLGTPGGALFQGILIVVGIILLLVGIRREQRVIYR